MMWTRDLLKTNAKAALRGRYWMAFLACLICGLFVGSGASGSGAAVGASGSMQAVGGASSVGGGMHGFESALDDLFAYPGGAAALTAILAVSTIILLLTVGIVLCLEIFVAYPVQVGTNRYFMENRLGQPSLGCLFSCFRAGYLRVIGAVFMKRLFVSLWSLLFVIPGIVKSYEYFFVEYLMAENPSLSWRRALELSRAMTHGEKWDIFVLELSFLGWLFLGALCCGVGTLFVQPYISATFAELYEASREKALANGMATAEELPGFVLHA